MRTLTSWLACAAIACSMTVADVRADELKERAAIVAEVARLMDANDYAGLEAMAKDFRQNKSRTESGVWKLSQFYGGISDKFDTRDQDGDTWDARGRWMTGWLKQYPSSPTALLAGAQLRVNLAWAYRGTSGYAYKVDKERWAAFKAQNSFAGEYLNHIRKVGRKDPEWYSLALEVARKGGASDTEYVALFDEATRRHPDYLEIHFQGVSNYVPKWGGNAEALDALVILSQKRVRAKDRAMLYARMYWAASQFQYGTTLFEDSKANWPRMQRGFDDMLERYPSEWNLQAYAYFACAAGDRTASQNLISRMAQPPILKVWDKQAIYDDCRAQSFTTASAGGQNSF
ncbi:hypothetical protein [Stenotrophomonas sp. PS02289]|uniref:hypothetical protein n=1 Tax=Stenotrophomonas sp. PS02289 TaxID=2991422 RepID=UPI00249A056E|nr:hypothetical protein [Stenotrophomonas sp. PS02289]